jgi:hypothetical protein
MANSNCLSGLHCPNCESFGPYHIDGTATFEVFDDGTSEFTNVEWDEDSPARCTCGFRGTLKDFQEKKTKSVRKRKAKKS